MTPEQAALLRKPFPPNVVGKLPKPYKKDAQRANCAECGGYHGLPAAHLDFVGHAATTDRLLQVDPDWSWEPMAVDQFGSPQLDRDGNLWIRLTLCGVTRIGVGDGSSMKERIGDAVRNAAMRFGVALDLWSKDELEQTSGEGAEKLRATLAGSPTPAPAPLADAGGEAALTPSKDRVAAQSAPPASPSEPEPITPAQVKKLAATMTELKMTDRAEALAYVESVIGRPVGSRNELTKVEAMRVINALQEGVPA